MVRYKPDHSHRTHEAIVDAAAALLREKGFERTSVGDVMKAVGLTHGGFYAHFDDKSALMVAALARALKPTTERFKTFADRAEESGDPAAAARTYLSDYHIEHPSEGCAVAALSSEVRRQPDDVRQAFITGAQEAARELGRLCPSDHSSTGADAWGVFALLFGALALMRAAPDEKTRVAIRERTLADLRILTRHNKK